MSKFLKLFGLFVLLSAAAAAQTTINPDCEIPFTFTAIGSTANTTCGHDSKGIVDWRVIYYSTGFSAISLIVQSAPDVAGSPGSWVSFNGTVNTGSNPNTDTNAATTSFTGYNPWVRVTLTSKTGAGSVNGKLYGCRSPGCSGGSASGGGGGSPPGGVPPNLQYNLDGMHFGGFDMAGDCSIPTIPNINCTKINGTSVPASPDTDGVLRALNGTTAGWAVVPDCSGSMGRLAWIAAAHTWDCESAVVGLTATLPVTVNNTDPNNPIAGCPTCVVGVTATSPIVADNTDPTNPIVTCPTCSTTPAGNFTQSFTGQTSVALAHNFGSIATVTQCFDGSNNYIEWDTLQIASNTNTVTFTTSQTGYCNVNGSGAPGGVVGVQSVSGTSPIVLDNTDPQNPIVTCPSCGGGGGGGSFGFTFTDPNLQTWTQQDFGSATSDTLNGISIGSTASEGSFNIHALTTPYPATPFHIEFGYLVLANGGGNFMAGSCISDGTKYEIYTTAFQGQPARQVAFTAANSGTYGGTSPIDQSTLSMNPLGFHWARYGDDGTNRSFDISADGIKWVPLPYNESNTAFLTPTTACFYINGAPQVIRLLSFKVTG